MVPLLGRGKIDGIQEANFCLFFWILKFHSEGNSNQQFIIDHVIHDNLMLHIAQLAIYINIPLNILIQHFYI